MPSNSRLAALVENFDSGEAGIRKQIRQCLEEDSRLFRDGAVEVFKSSPNSRGSRFIITLLISSDSLLGIVGDPALTLAEAVAFTRIALDIDPLTDVNLVKKLTESVSGEISAAAMGRVLDVLEEVSTGNRLMPWLVQLWRRKDHPQARGKAVKMIGRVRRSRKWIESRFSAGDPRECANAVEALWGLDTDEARDAMRTASRDSNNRVAANALYALYHMGDEWTIAELLKMSASKAPLFRASAAWAMGETKDSRFSEALSRMMGDADAMVRKRAFRSLGRLKASAVAAAAAVTPPSAVEESPKREWRLLVRILPGMDGSRQIFLEVRPGSDDGVDSPNLKPDEFVLTEDGQPIRDFRVAERPVSKLAAVSLMFPRDADSTSPRWVDDALKRLAEKHPDDRRHVAYYQEGLAPSALEFALPSFLSKAESKRAAASPPARTIESNSFWPVLRGRMQNAAALDGGMRNLIVICLADPGTPDDPEGILSAALSSQIGMHVIARDPNRTLKDLCRQTNSRYQIAAPRDDLASLVEEAYLTFLWPFAITYQPLTPNAASLRLRVANTTGWGETTIVL